MVGGSSPSTPATFLFLRVFKMLDKFQTAVLQEMRVMLFTEKASTSANKDLTTNNTVATTPFIVANSLLGEDINQAVQLLNLNLPNVNSWRFDDNAKSLLSAKQVILPFHSSSLDATQKKELWQALLNSL